ncbi:MAG TPA: phosphoribosylanthranilate isomerase [Longimicrobiaceae bacterium]|nr:phosphoribosylanthranilate isomerase [Longimicrobiaceae bacterium]
MTERRVAVKICGLRRREDAERAAALGADYGGVVLAPGGKRSILPEDAGRVLQGLPLRRVGVFVDASADEVARAAEVVGLQVLQLHGEEPPEALRALRAEGRWEVWKAVRPRSAEELSVAVERYADVADALLLDGWSASAPGGTGSRFPWEVVAAERDSLPSGLALVAAGGLTPANVAEAIALLRPDVVDVSSGVESAPGVKDAAALSAFLSAARAADIPAEAKS